MPFSRYEKYSLGVNSKTKRDHLRNQSAQEGVKHTGGAISLTEHFENPFSPVTLSNLQQQLLKPKTQNAIRSHINCH